MSVHSHRAERPRDVPQWLVAELDVEPAPARVPRRRGSDRVEVNMGADLRKRGETRLGIEIADLSTSGFRARAHRDLAKGMDVWLRLPGLESLPARVVWSDGRQIGCAFLQPLHPAVLDLLIARAAGR